MAYNKEKLTKLEALQELAQQSEQKYATKESVNTLSGRVDLWKARAASPTSLRP